MALPTYYNTGTASVGAGATAVTGVGTAWLTAGLQAGDYFSANGLRIRIASVNSNTSITLATGWPGTALSGSNYEIQITPEATRVLTAMNTLLETLSNGNLSSIAGLTSAADRVPYFTGSGTAALATLTSSGRALLGLTGANGKIPVWTAAGTAAARDILGTVSQSSGVPTGSLFEAGSNANGNYIRSADGLQICWLYQSSVSISSNSAVGSVFRDNAAVGQWTFPATFVSGSNPVGSFTINSSFIWGIAGATTTTTMARSIMSAASFVGSVGAQNLAVGRWF
jgi:hypothetical protein